MAIVGGGRGKPKENDDDDRGMRSVREAQTLGSLDAHTGVVMVL